MYHCCGLSLTTILPPITSPLSNPSVFFLHPSIFSVICFYGKLDWQVLLDSFTKATAIIKHEEEVAREELRRLTHTSEEIHRSSNQNASEIVPYAQALLNPSHAKCIETYLNFAFYAVRLAFYWWFSYKMWWPFSWVFLQWNQIYNKNSWCCNLTLTNIDFCWFTISARIVLHLEVQLCAKVCVSIIFSGIVLLCNRCRWFKIGDVSMQESTGTSSEKAIWGLHRRPRPLHTPP